jgi:hypothetical protein
MPSGETAPRAPVQEPAGVAVRLELFACTINWRHAPNQPESAVDKDQKWLVGIDWGSQEHVVSLCDGTGQKIGQRKFPHGGAGLSDMIAWLLRASGGKPGEIHVAIETPHGPIVEALLERGFNVYSINPKQLDRFRDRFTVSGAKDDSRDVDAARKSGLNFRTCPRARPTTWLPERAKPDPIPDPDFEWSDDWSAHRTGRELLSEFDELIE